MKTVLTIAGSDCSGGAGIQADIKTITAHKLYAMSAITALTAQNTTGIYGALETPPAFLQEQLDRIFEDIFPDAVKIGMLANAASIKVVADCLQKYAPKNIVLDPVLLSSSGSRLLDEEALEVLSSRLFPLVDLVTPNLPEAEKLSGLQRQPEKNGEAALQTQPLHTSQQIEKTAGQLAMQYQTAVLIKGGHGRTVFEGEGAQKNTANDLLCYHGKFRWYEGERLENPNTHGTGCTLSSAIACNLALGYGMEESVARAKQYLWGAIRDGLELGKGAGPLNHTYWLYKINTKKRRR